MWDNLKIINPMTNDGECNGNNGGDTMGKSMAFWIDD
jgi:hypothetical protein